MKKSVLWVGAGALVGGITIVMSYAIVNLVTDSGVTMDAQYNFNVLGSIGVVLVYTAVIWLAYWLIEKVGK